MAGGLEVEHEGIDPPEISDPLERALAEGQGALEGVKRENLEQLPERDVVVLRQRFQYLEDGAVHPKPRLHPHERALPGVGFELSAYPGHAFPLVTHVPIY